jgi:N-acetylglutamate synthase-like GNAT family acetyltransferase
VGIPETGTGETKVTIRPATRQEIATLFRTICSNGIMPSLFDSNRLSQCDEIFSAEIDGQIAGVVALASTGCDGSGVPTLATIYTVRAFRNRGVALSLCEHGIRRLADAGKTPIYVDVTSRGAHETIKRLPPEVQAHLKPELSYQVYGDEFDGRPW